METEPSDPTPILLSAAAGNWVERPPVWMMRQAGRYMEEYRKVRERHSFLEVCHQPELAAEVSLQPLDAFDVDGVILFSDILVPLDALGVEYTLDHGGPRIAKPVRTEQDLKALAPRDPREAVPFVYDAIRLLRKELEGRRVPLIGFCGAPFTLAAYLVEGKGSSRGFEHLRALMYREPALTKQLLETLTQTMAAYLEAQVDAGAQIVQVFDTWAGELSGQDYEEFALPYEREIIHRARAKNVPVTLFVKGSMGWLELVQRAGADVVSLDWRTPIDAARKTLGTLQAVQGNLDPGILLGTPELVRERTRALIQKAGTRGHILNLGHGILPSTPRECAQAFVETAKEWRWDQMA